MLKCFATVAERGSLTEAAEVLGRTPSAISMMLKQFEDHIGAALFETTRKSHLTPLGALIFEEARREISHFEKTVAVIEGLSRSELGYLRLAVTPSVASTVLPEIILQFTQRFKDVQVDIRDMDSASIAQALIHDRADIGIGTFPTPSGMTGTHLFSDRFGVICRADHELARTWDQLTWRDMQDYDLIANGLCHLIADPDFAPVLAKSRLAAPSTASLFGLVRAGVGISVLPQLAALGAPADLVFLPLKDATARRVVQMVSHDGKYLLPAARAFKALVVEIKRDAAFAAHS